MTFPSKHKYPFMYPEPHDREWAVQYLPDFRETHRTIAWEFQLDEKPGLRSES